LIQQPKISEHLPDVAVLKCTQP